MVALNGYCSTMHVELHEATRTSQADLDDDKTEDESQWQPEVEVMYQVDESPPISLCFLLGFQVRHGKQMEVYCRNH